METERLRRSGTTAMTLTGWQALVPTDLAPEVDLERLEGLLRTGGDAGREQALAMLKPDAKAVVSALRRIGALVETAEGHWSLRPVWLANRLRGEATKLLYNDGPDGLGALLLSSETAGGTLTHLLDTVRGGTTALAEACIDGVDLTRPESVAAFDGAFRALGLAVAGGAPVPVGTLERAWQRQMTLVIRPSAEWLPTPMLRVSTKDSWPGYGTQAAWRMAAVAVSRALVEAGRVVPPSALNPWNGLPDDERERRHALELLAGLTPRWSSPLPAGPEHATLESAAFRLGGQLLEKLGVLRHQGRPLEIQGPDQVVALSMGAMPPGDDAEIDDLLELRFGLRALEEASDRRETTLDATLAWCWRRWGRDQDRGKLYAFPPLGWLRKGSSDSGPDELRRVWAAAPPSALTESFCGALNHQGQADWMGGAAWLRWSRPPPTNGLQSCWTGQRPGLLLRSCTPAWGRGSHLGSIAWWRAAGRTGERRIGYWFAASPPRSIERSGGAGDRPSRAALHCCTTRPVRGESPAVETRETPKHANSRPIRAGPHLALRLGVPQQRCRGATRTTRIGQTCSVGNGRRASEIQVIS